MQPTLLIPPSLSRLPPHITASQVVATQPTNVYLSPGRLLMPTLGPQRGCLVFASPTLSTTGSLGDSPIIPRSPRLRPTTGKLIRTKSATHSSADVNSSSTHIPVPTVSADVGSEWLGIPLKFEVVEDQIEVEGYQMYAVEKWIVERGRPVKTLTVYTGNPSHKITVTALSPSSALSQSDAQAEWEKALHHLRRDGARPKETPCGILTVTSLAHFRSDFTIVHIPDGNFLDAKEQLYTNINLLRMGCSGRSAVTLEESSDTTKARFTSMYNLSETIFSATAASPSDVASNTKLQDYSPKARLRSSSTGVRSNKSKSLDLSTEVLKGVGLGKQVGIGGGPMITTTPPTPTPNSEEDIPYLPTHTRKKSHPMVAMTRSGPNKSKTKDFALFNTTVLELVKLVQASLAIFGMFPLISEGREGELNGLLCDVTVDGIQRWVAEIGEPCVGVEPMERVADPAVVTALLSLVLATRNQLAAIGFGHVMPRDPFLNPEVFTTALAHYIQSTNLSPLVNASPHLYNFCPPHYPSHQARPNTASAIAPGISITFDTNPPQRTCPTLTRTLVENISSSYDRFRQNDARKMHKVIWNKLDGVVGGDRDRDRDRDGSDYDMDVGRDGRGGRGRRDGGSGGVGVENGGGLGIGGGGQLLSGIASGLGLGGSTDGGASILEATMDIVGFVKVIVKRGRGEKADTVKEKDAGVGASVRALWSGRVGELINMREREKIGALGKANKVKSDNDRVWSDGDKESDRERTDGRLSSEDESEIVGAFGMGVGKPWSGRVQKKIESWTGLGRGKKSLDVPGSWSRTTAGRFSILPLSAESSTSSQNPPPSQQQPMSDVVSGDGDDDEMMLSSGQISPIGGARPFGALYGKQPADNLELTGPSISEHDKLVTAFNRRRPWGGYQSRVSSWSDPISAWGTLEEEAERKIRKGRSKTRLRRPSSSSSEDDEEKGLGESEWSWDGVLTQGLKRRRSFHDLSSLSDMRVLSVERMKIDVELSGQCLIMWRRAQHMDDVLACLQALTSSLSATNASLHANYQSHQQLLADVEARAKVIAQIDDDRARTDMMSQETNTLRYEALQFRVSDLWHMASPPRQIVLELRENVFGTGGRRLPPGVSGAHGRFNRLQWTLDGQQRLVDWMGRTESEVDEESALGEILLEEIEEEDVVEHAGIKPMWLLRFFHSWGAKWGWGVFATTKKVENTNGSSMGPNMELSKGHSASVEPNGPGYGG